MSTQGSVPIQIQANSYRQRFTLVELMVVIAIILILASILSPMLRKAQLQAKALACMNNQKQTLFAQALYSGDHSGIIAVSSPYGAFCEPFSTLLTREKSNTGLLDKSGRAYTTWDTLLCPSNPFANKKAADAVWFSTFGMWLYNGISRAACLNRTGNIFGEATSTPSSYNSVHIFTTRAKQPAATFILADTVVGSTGGANVGKPIWAFWANAAKEGGGVSTIHLGRANCGFLDGHVKLIFPIGMKSEATYLSFYVDYVTYAGQYF